MIKKHKNGRIVIWFWIFFPQMSIFWSDPIVLAKSGIVVSVGFWQYTIKHQDFWTSCHRHNVINYTSSWCPTKCFLKCAFPLHVAVVSNKTENMNVFTCTPALLCTKLRLLSGYYHSLEKNKLPGIWQHKPR